VSAEREELRRLVEELPDEQIRAALVQIALVRRSASGDGNELCHWPPSYFDLGTAMRTDTAARVDELLAEGFSRSA
jgi:hypothetical protein